ncbi:MAG: patatin-like phospholipase family protein [Caulobacteraceae bacterium]|nr:patatin-like phospholipase family protein [Caulobacteraceae bacterium]
MAAPPAPADVRADPGVAEVRYFVARDPGAFEAAAREAFRRELAWRASTGQTGPLPPVNFLAISGGGHDGAFAAGLLNGWTAHGDRPEFKAVTGISTGALIAPFAFLGPRYDGTLKDLYTNISQADIYRKRLPFSALFNDALSSTEPLARLTSHYVTRQLLDEIAAEYAKGRMLLIGTTDLDNLEPVVWNMTAIAASHDPHAVELFREVLMASAAIPGAFPPVMINVTLDGVHYQEMHVDGGVAAQVFTYPPSLNVGQLSANIGAVRERKLYIIRNARLDPDWANTKRRTLSIAGRAIASLIQTQGVGDLYRIYVTARRDHIDYNLAFIPSTFTTVATEQFDTAYMRTLYQTGYDLGAKGYVWSKTPPAYQEATFAPAN